MGSNNVSDEKLKLVLERMPPCTLPKQAFGPNEIEWAGPSERRSVWAWITWPNGAATRVKAAAHGWNDRVVVVQWNTTVGDVQCVVWRNAVTLRHSHPRNFRDLPASG